MNNDGITLRMNEDGVFEKYEPFMVIECPTEKDFEQLQNAVATYQNFKELTSVIIEEFADRICEGRVGNDPVRIAVQCALEEFLEDWNEGEKE